METTRINRGGMGDRSPANGTANNKNGRKSKRSRLTALTYKVRRFFVALLALLVLAALAQLLFGAPKARDSAVYISDSTFFKGISINGYDVSGLTYAAARDMLCPKIEAQARTVNITVKHGTSFWLLTAPDLGLESDLDAVLLEALKLGRADSYVNNQTAKKDLEENGRNFAVTVRPGEKALDTAISAIGAAINTEPTEPFAEPDAWSETPEFTFHEGAAGYLLNEAALKSDITERIEAGSYNAVLEPTLVLTPPTHDTAWLKANTQLRSQFQTEYGSTSSLKKPERRANIRKAANILNGATVQVGATFDFNEYIGPRTEAGGWPLAPGIVNGNTYEMQAGGGICQVSTTLYNALLCSGPEITIVERYHHSWPSHYADYGLDATVSTGGKNLVFTNNSEAPLYIFAYPNDTDYTMTVYIYGAPLPEGVTYKVRGVTTETIEPEETIITENPDWPTGFKYNEITSRTGYVAVAYRDKLVNGTVTDTETLYTDKYRAVQGKTTVGTGPATLPEPVIPTT
ncbi:MAG: VanW family protein [Clostridiaceae bacterium]|nr:VanW family protein [Eubacteriales bacterium]